jgi:N6-L-threonylcarbamoyladenine synthase
MKILGIETSCDETSAAIAESRDLGFKVLSNIVSSQAKIHAKYGGVVPEVAARKHVETILPILEKAMGGRNEKTIDAIAVTTGPGLITSLLVGAEVARVLSYIWQKPLVAVNHLEGHIYANWLLFSRHSEERSDEESRTNVRTRMCERSFASLRMTGRGFGFPILCLVVSGGHTELVLMTGHGKYKVIGRTRDDAAGECFDKTAKILGLGYPGGPAIAKFADYHQSVIARSEATKQSRASTRSPRPDFIGARDDALVHLPRPMIDSPEFDFSFSGLKTAVLYAARDLDKKYSLKKIQPRMAFEVQEAIVDVLVAKTIWAARKYGVKTVMLAGGVSANKRLREQFVTAVKRELSNTKYQIPDTKYCTDNAAMIAAAGYFHAIKKDFTSWQKLKVDPNWEIS